MSARPHLVEVDSHDICGLFIIMLFSYLSFLSLLELVILMGAGREYANIANRHNTENRSWI